MRLGGTIQIQAGGELLDAAGEFEYSLGTPVRETVVGPTKVLGYSETASPPFLEGEVQDRPDLDLEKVLTFKGGTITLSLANGKVIVFRDAWQAGDGATGTAKGNTKVRFEALGAEEIR